MNFSDASKADNGGKDIDIAAMSGSEKYQPRKLTAEPDGNIYIYTVTSKDEGKTVLRFWRGNESTLWNCSISLDYDSYKAGNNCVRVTVEYSQASGHNLIYKNSGRQTIAA